MLSLAATLCLALLAGAAVGLLNFLALWAGVRRLAAPRAAAWMALSLLARFALIFAAFLVVVERGGWPAVVAALAGFLAARTVVVRRVRRRTLDSQPAQRP